jgi:hypothetical protein
MIHIKRLLVGLGIVLSMIAVMAVVAVIYHLWPWVTLVIPGSFMLLMSYLIGRDWLR